MVNICRFTKSVQILPFIKVPSHPPANIRVNNTSRTKQSCEVQWDPVPAEHQNGVIIGYELLYSMTSQPAIQQSINVTADTYSYVLTALDSYKEYNISIVAMTSVGKGVRNQESAVTCLTKSDYPPVSPTGLSVVNTTSESCHINWTAVSSQDARGEVIGYLVSVVKNDSSSSLSALMIVCVSLTYTTISNLDWFSLYNIKAAVFNDAGKGNFSETLKCITGEAAPSLPPQNISAHNTSARSIMVKWDPVPEPNRHGIVREYHISIWPVHSPSQIWRYVDTNGSFSKEIWWLQPYTNYSITVAAHTVATGNYSKPFIVTTGEAAPTTSPQIVKLYNTSGRSIFVQWTPPQGPIPGVIRGYRIFYKNMNISFSPTKNVTVDASTLSHEITELEIYSRYLIVVIAFTVAGGPSSYRFVYTDKKNLPPPDGIPGSLTAGDKTSRNCEVIWEEVVNSHPDPDGAVTGYLIYYRKAASYYSFNKLDVPGANTTSFIIENLEEFTHYEFKVVAYNDYGEGNSSEISHCRTEEDVPSASPVNTTSIHITPREIELKWDLPPEEDWNGIIRGFVIMYYRKDEGNSSARYVNIPVSKRRKRALSSADLSWSLTGLDEFTLYVLRVLVYTIGNSDYSPPVEIRTAEDAPSSPPAEIMADHNGSSTSLWVKWNEVPYADQNGIIRGFVIRYWVKGDPETATYTNVTESSVITYSRRKRAATASYMYQLTGLRIWTEYLVTAAAYTVSQGPSSEPYMARTDEGVPCMPPQDVTYDIPGLTMLLAKWKPVPVHCRNGIILGYRIRYQRMDGAYQVRTENTTADVLYAFLYDMDIYANYSIEITAFTRKGEGNTTRDLALPDSLGTKSTPINVTAQNHTSTSSINITWEPIKDELIVEKMMGYRVSYRAVSIGDEEVEDGQPTYNLTFRKTTFQAVIEGLDTYTRYQFNVSGFTRMGDGPSAITAGETCRCHKRLTTNYRLFPPYVDQIEVAGDGHTTVANMNGMLPVILNDLVITCCSTCGAHGTSYVDFEYNGANGTAKQNSEQEMKALIDDTNDLSFPVYGWKWQEHYYSIYRYIPLVESPGVAFIIIGEEVMSPSERLVRETFGTWPYVITTTLLSILAGIVIWILDWKYNPDEFPRSFCSGAWNGFWWAFISITTLGYGDKVPRARVSRIFSILWILIGLVLMGILTGALTSAVTMFVFTTDITLYGAKVAAIQDTPEYRLAVSRNAKVNTAKNYTTFLEVYDALIKEEVQGMLIDTYEAGSKRDQFKDPRIRVRNIFDFKSTYGVVLAGNSTKLMSCSKSYMQSHRAEMFHHIAKFIHSIEEDDVPESQEMASGLFDPENDLFRYIVYFCSGLLCMAVILGLIWEYRRKLQAREASILESDPSRVKAKDLFQEMKTLVEEFCFTFKTNYHHLSKKHRAQLSSIITQNNVVCNPDTKSSSNA